MASRSTRNKIRLQGSNAYGNLHKAQSNLVQLAALADEHSTYINDNVPEIIAALEVILNTVEKFNEGL